MSFQTYLLSTTIDLSTHSVDSKCVKNSQTHKNVKSQGKTGNHSSSSSTKWKKEVPGPPGTCLYGPLSFLVAIPSFCYANAEYMKGPGSQWSSQHGHLEFYSRYPPFLSRVPPPIALLHSSIVPKNPTPRILVLSTALQAFPSTGCWVSGRRWAKRCL